MNAVEISGFWQDVPTNAESQFCGGAEVPPHPYITALRRRNVHPAID
jgi:hypothetical protein